MDKYKDIPKMQGKNGGTLLAAGTGAGGRPKKLPNIDELGAQLLSEEKSGMIALEAIIKSMIHKAVKGDTNAAKLVLDRFYGVSKQSIDHTTKGESLNTPFLNIPLEKRLQALEILESESEGQVSNDETE